MKPNENVKSLLVIGLVLIVVVGGWQLISYKEMLAERDRISKIEESNRIIDQVRTKSYNVWMQDEKDGKRELYSVSLETAMEGTDLDQKSLRIRKKGSPGVFGMIGIAARPAANSGESRPGWSEMDIGNGKYRVKYTARESGLLFAFSLDSFTGEIEPDNDNATRLLDLLYDFSRR